MARRSHVERQRRELANRVFIYDEDILLAETAENDEESGTDAEVVDITRSPSGNGSTEPLDRATLDKALGLCGLQLLRDVGAEIDRLTVSPTGRPRRHGAYVYLLVDMIATRKGGARNTIREIRSPLIWRAIRRRVRENWPDVRIDPRPPTRSGFGRFKAIMKAHPELVALYKAAVDQWSVDVGRVMGLMTEENRSFTTPDASNVLFADGTWINSLYNAAPGSRGARRVDRETGEITLTRTDPDALAYHGEGSGGAGRYWTIFGGRTPFPHERLIYDISPLPKRVGEGTYAAERLLALQKRGVAARGLAYDMKVMGRASERVLAAKVLPITKLPRRDGKIPTHHFGPKKAVTPSGKSVTLDLWAIDGALRIRLPDDEGTAGYLLLDRKKIEYRKTAVYLTAAVPDRPEAPKAMVGAQVRVRLDTTPEDEKVGFLRSTYVRGIAPAHPEFGWLYGLRNNIESINDQVKSHLFNRRQRSVGVTLQTMNLVSDQVMTNLTALLAWWWRTDGDVHEVWAKPPPELHAGPVAYAA